MPHSRLEVSAIEHARRAVHLGFQPERTYLIAGASECGGSLQDQRMIALPLQVREPLLADGYGFIRRHGVESSRDGGVSWSQSGRCSRTHSRASTVTSLPVFSHIHGVYSASTAAMNTFSACFIASVAAVPSQLSGSPNSSSSCSRMCSSGLYESGSGFIGANSHTVNLPISSNPAG